VLLPVLRPENLQCAQLPMGLVLLPLFLLVESALQFEKALSGFD